MDKKIFYEELKRTQKQIFSYGDDDLIYVLSFMRHMKENHVLGDFRVIWRYKLRRDICTIFDIFKESSLYNPYISGFAMNEWGLRLHYDGKFYFNLSSKLRTTIQHYKLIQLNELLWIKEGI